MARDPDDIRYVKKTLDTRLDKSDYVSLVKAIRKSGCIPMATPFDEKSVGLCDELGVDIIKLASSDLNDWILIEKVATTKIVDAVEPLLRDNLNGYLSGPRTRASQAQALANFDAGWQYVVEHCDIPEMGNPGKACVSDRSPGGQWDWFAYYRNPIANDTEVRDDVGAAVSDTVATLNSATVGGLPAALLLLGALVAVGIFAGGKK